MQNPPDRGRDFARGKSSSGHLIKQRLEGVVVLAVNEGHADIAIPQLPGGLQTAKPTPDNHYTREARIGLAYHII
jgi:hypothetical protein